MGRTGRNGRLAGRSPLSNIRQQTAWQANGIALTGPVKEQKIEFSYNIFFVF
jgi:hypothetical protein